VTHRLDPHIRPKRWPLNAAPRGLARALPRSLVATFGVAIAAILTAAQAGCVREPVDPGPRVDGTDTKVTRPAPPASVEAANTKGQRAERPIASAPAARTSAPAAKTPAAPTLQISENPPVRMTTPWSSSTKSPLARIEETRTAKIDTVRQLFASAGVTFPPAELLLRAFKQERRLEVWAASAAAQTHTHVTTYEICAASGELGPKRIEGDGQVPEGFYTIDYYNPASAYYLSMRVSYPNASDKVLSNRSKPGSEIMIHGNCVSAGCLAMTDERIQELWVTVTAMRDTHARTHVHIFPSRDMKSLLTSTEHTQHNAFWANLKEGLDLFEQKKKLPKVTVREDGRYAFR
jgi:hypothetical protein